MTDQNQTIEQYFPRCPKCGATPILAPSPIEPDTDIVKSGEINTGCNSCTWRGYLREVTWLRV